MGNYRSEGIESSAYTLFLILILLILSLNSLDIYNVKKTKPTKKQAKENFKILPSPQKVDKEQDKTREQQPKEDK